MDQATVFTKTAKGITQVNQRTASLSKDLMKVLKLIDGKSNLGQLAERAELDKNQLEKALNTLTRDGFARVFQTRKVELDPLGDAGGDDFDFTAPGKMPAATQRVIPGAANDISELVRHQEKAEADRKAKEQAHTQAAAKAKAEAQVRAKLEAEARARQEAERQAMEQAQKAKEAAERARAQVEAQKREEEARQKAIAEQQVKLTAEQKAREEAESRRLAELRVKAEREAKALAEARARAEAEAAAMAKARAEAEAAARKQAAEATQAQAEMKARLKEEIEARIRGEMEELLKTEVEDKTREAMKAEIMAEAKLAAQAELEERLREEREAIARAESEARAKAEEEARARADIEAKKRAEAEARAKAETEARIRAEEETKRLRAQMEEESKRAAQAAEARARESAEIEKRLESERQAKHEAEARARIEAEERNKRERELSATIEAERKAKVEAETRARIEARARETIAQDTRAKVQAELESNLAKKAEIEGKAQAVAYMQAKEKAEQEEEQKIRDEQAKRAREIAQVLRTRVDAEEAVEAAAPKRRPRRARPGSIVKLAAFGSIALLVIVVALLHVVPLRPYTAKVERTLAEWLQDDVSIGSMTFRLVPSPHLRVENVAVGKSLDAKAASGRLDLAILSLFGDKPSINSIELENISLSPEAVGRIPRWGRVEGKGGSGGIERISLRGVKLDVKPPLEPFNATMSFARDGALRQAVLNAPSGWAVTVKPAAEGLEFDATARNLSLPMGPAFPVADSRFKGTLVGKQIVVPDYEIETMGGTVKGSLRISWDQNVRLESEMTMARVNAGELVGAFTKAIVITGRMEGAFNVATEGPSLEQLFASPRAQGKFRVGEGSISNVDLVAVMQSESAGTRAGVTKFNEISGELASTDARTSFNRLALEGGVLRSNGNVEVAQGAVAGRLQIEIRSRVASDRGSFSLSGSVSRPILKRN
jgi:hypothetical protein